MAHALAAMSPPLRSQDVVRAANDLTAYIMASVESGGAAYWCGRPAEIVLRDRWLTPLRESLPHEQVDQWSAEGRSLPLDRAVKTAEGLTSGCTTMPRFSAA
jgi:hypothetical protein